MTRQGEAVGFGFNSASWGRNRIGEDIKHFGNVACYIGRI